MTSIAHGELQQAVAHRPWPLPERRWVMFQRWQELLFAHWPVSWRALRSRIPRALELEQCEGSAWLGLTPFRLTDLHPRAVPPVPVLSSFPEMNLRTYVRFRGRPGIYFFSLYAGRRAAVVGARALYRLPYRYARMKVGERDGWIRYRSRLPTGRAALEARYRPAGAPFCARPGTLEHFLTERYVLYTVLRTGTVLAAEIHHRPWHLHSAEARFLRNAVPEANDVPLSDGGSPLLHFARRQDVLVWPPQLLG